MLLFKIVLMRLHLAQMLGLFRQRAALIVKPGVLVLPDAADALNKWEFGHFNFISMMSPGPPLCFQTFHDVAGNQ